MRKISVIWMCFYISTQKISCLNIKVMPTHIDPGTTENLLVNCSLNVEKTPELAFLNSLVLSRSVDMNKSDYQVVASINAVGGRVNVYDGDGVGSGVVSNKGESYMSVKWAYPLDEKAGTYLCQTNGMSLSWKPQTFSVSAEISASVLSQSALVELVRSNKLENIQRVKEIKTLNEEIKTLTEENKLLKNNVTLSTNYIYGLKEKDNTTIKTLFYESSLYNGHRYYLTRESVLVLNTQAQATCNKYGGYLAEIDDDAEFNFVRQFLKSYTSYLGVFISGSDEGHEGYWTNPRNNTVLKYIKWANGEPNGGKGENCLYILRDLDWFIIDSLCVRYNIDQAFGYLCEDLSF